MAEIKIGVQISDVLRDKISEINNTATMLAIHNTLAKRCDPYVPFLEGPLSQTVQVSDSSSLSYRSKICPTVCEISVLWSDIRTEHTNQECRW